MFSTEYLSVKVIVVGFKRNPDYTVVGLCRLHCTTMVNLLVYHGILQYTLELLIVYYTL